MTDLFSTYLYKRLVQFIKISMTIQMFVALIMLFQFLSDIRI